MVPRCFIEQRVFQAVKKQNSVTFSTTYYEISFFFCKKQQKHAFLKMAKKLHIYRFLCFITFLNQCYLRLIMNYMYNSHRSFNSCDHRLRVFDFTNLPSVYNPLAYDVNIYNAQTQQTAVPTGMCCNFASSLLPPSLTEHFPSDGE